MENIVNSATFSKRDKSSYAMMADSAQGSRRRRAISSANLLTDVVRLIPVPLATIAKPVLQSLPKTDVLDELYAFLVKVPCKHFSLDQIADKCAAVASQSPSILFHSLNGAFLAINLDLNKPIAQSAPYSENLLSRLTPLQENSLNVRIALFYILDVVKAEMTLRIVKKINLSEPCARDFLFDVYFNPFCEESGNPVLAKLRLLNAERWEKVFYYASILSPVSAFSFVVNVVKRDFKFDEQKIFLLRVIRSLCLDKVHAKCFNPVLILPSILKAIEQLRNPTQFSSEYCDALTHFMTSFTGQMLIKFDGQTHNDALAALLLFANNGRKTSPYAAAILVSFYLHSAAVRKRTSLRELIQQSKQYFLTAPSVTLDSIVRILRGPNFSVHHEVVSISKFVPAQMDPSDVTHIPSLFNALCPVTDSFGECSEELTMVLVHLAVNDFSYFCDTCVPVLIQPSFLNVNAKAFFDACMIIVRSAQLKQSHQTKLNEFKAQLRDCVTFYILESERKSESYVFHIENSNSDPFDFLDNPGLQQVSLPTARPFHSDVNKWRKALLREDEENPIFESYPQKTLRGKNELSLSSSPLVPCLALSALLPYSKNLVSVILQLISDEELHVSTVAARALISIGITNPSETRDIIQNLADLDMVESNEQLYMRIVIIDMLASNVKTDDLDEILIDLVVIGLCSSSVEVRSAVFNLIDFIPQLSFLTSEASSKEIFEESVMKMSVVVGRRYDETVWKALPIRSIRELANSQYEMLYHIFLSIAFSRSVETELICKARTGVMKHLGKKCISTMNMANLCTFVAATATATQPGQAELADVIITAIRILMENRIYSNVLFSFATSVNPLRIYNILNLLTGQHDIFRRAFVLTARMNWDKISDDRKTEIMNFIVDECENIVTYMHASKYVSMTKVEEIQTEVLETGILYRALYDFVKLTKQICEFYAKCHLTEPMGPVLRRAYVDEDFKRQKWMIFLLNITRISQSKFSKLAKAAKLAFAALCSVTTIPENLAEVITIHIKAITKDNNDAATNILSHSYHVMLDGFIKGALSNPDFMICIANQFEKLTNINDAKNILQRRMNSEPSESDLLFTNTTLSCTGSLLAISMYYLSGDKNGCEEYALQIIKNLVISCTVLRKSDSFASVLTLLNEKWTTSHGSFRDMYQLSRKLATAFRFCAEPFLQQAMSMEYSPCFCCMLEPWFRYVRLSYNNTSVVSKCEQKCFNSYTFMNAFLSGFCKNSIAPPVIDLINQFNDSEIAFVIALRLSRVREKECFRFMTYLCSANEHLIDKLCELFSFKFWYFEVVHLSKCDDSFDIDAFLSGMKNGSSSHAHGGHALEEHYSMTLFAISVAAELIKTSSYARERIIPYLLSFCLITQNNEVSRLSDQKETVIDHLLSDGDHSVDAMIELMSSSARAQFARCCFDWAASCGRISYAYEATNLTVGSINEALPSLDWGETVLRSLKICTMVLYEVDRLDMNSTPSDFMRSNPQPKIPPVFFSYVGNLIYLVSKINLLLKAPTQKIVSTVAEFVKWNGQKRCFEIFQAAVNGLYDHAQEAPDLINVHESSSGLLCDITFYEMPCDTGLERYPQVIERFCEIVLILVKNGSFNSLFKSSNAKAAVAICIFSILPFCIGDSSRLEDLSKVAQTYLQVRIHPSAPLDSTKDLLSYVKAEDLATVFRFFNILAEFVPEYSSSVYLLCAHLIESDIGPEICDYALKIAIRALRERERLNSASACRFLSAYQMISEIETQPDSFRRLPFPPTLIDSSFTTSGIDNLDLPPLMFIDNEFRELQMVTDMREACSSLDIMPFTRWFQNCFSGEEVVEVPRAPVTTGWSLSDFDEFCQILVKMDTKKRSLSRMHQGSASSCVFTEKLSDRLLAVDIEVFASTRDDIDAIAPELNFM